MMLKNKTGSHVSVIISFVVFITFLIFFFFIFEPSFGFNSSKKSTVESAAVEFENYLSSDLNTITVYLDEEPASACIRMMNFETLDDVGFAGTNMFVKNSEGSALDFDWDESTTHLMAQSPNGNRFFKIYASDGIISEEGSFSSCQDFLSSEYTVAVKKDRYVSEEKIISAFSLYKTNYNQLKQNIGITSEEFGFDFVYGNGTIFSTGNASNEQILNIYTKRINVDYFDKNLNFDTGNIIVKIW